MKQSILMVDDHRENLIALEAILEAPDRNLVMATTGNEALQLALKHDFALILLDVQMPEIDGFEVAELLRRNRKTRSIPIIFVTAISKESKYVSQGYECGAVDYLFKPLDQNILIAKVDFFLELDMQRRKLQQAVVQMKRLKDENERLLQAIGEGVLGTDEQGMVTFTNPAAAMLLKTDQSSLLGVPVLSLLSDLEPKDAAQSWSGSDMVSACQSGEKWQTVTPMRKTIEEALVSISVSANPLNAKDEPFRGCVLLIRDVTGKELSDAERAAREQRRHPRKKMHRELVVFDRTSGGNVGRLTNLSEGGFKLQISNKLTEGQKYNLSMILPAQLEGLNTLTFEAKVVWSEMKPATGEWRAGFEFDQPTDQLVKIVQTLMEQYQV